MLILPFTPQIFPADFLRITPTRLLPHPAPRILPTPKTTYSLHTIRQKSNYA